jgi:hypothetical protein
MGRPRKKITSNEESTTISETALVVEEEQDTEELSPLRKMLKMFNIRPQDVMAFKDDKMTEFQGICYCIITTDGRKFLLPKNQA